MAEDDITSDDGGEDAAPTGANNYEVGYRKPPKHTRFKAGNKRGGRTKGSRNLKTMVIEVLGAKLPVEVNGKRERLAAPELGLRHLRKRAARGDPKAIDRVLELYERFGPPFENVEETSDAEAAYDLETLKHALRMKGMGGDEEGED